MNGRWEIEACRDCGWQVDDCDECGCADDENQGERVDVVVVPVEQAEALKARLRQEVDAHRMTLHPRALPFTDEEWQGYLGTIPGLEEGP